MLRKEALREVMSHPVTIDGNTVRDASSLIPFNSYFHHWGWGAPQTITVSTEVVLCVGMVVPDTMGKWKTLSLPLIEAALRHHHQTAVNSLSNPALNLTGHGMAH